MAVTNTAIRPDDPLAAFSELVSFAVGMASVVLAVVGGFGLTSVVSVLKALPGVDGQVFISATFALERWLLVAVLVTAFYSAVFYVFFVKELSDLHRKAQESERGTVLLALVVFPILNFSVIAAVGLLTWNYCQELGGVFYLKWATGVLLLSFVVNDVLSIGFGSMAESAEHLKASGWKALCRLDLPVLVAYGLLLLFVRTETNAGGTSKELLSAFSLGAAAFKLLVTVTIFTHISYEDYSRALSRLGKKE